MSKAKRRGPTTDPWGTPFFTTFSLDFQPQIVVYCFVPFRKIWAHALADTLIPEWASF